MSSNSPISSAATINNPISPHNHSMVPQLYGIKAVAYRASVDDLGVQSIQTRIPAVLILFGFLVEALNVTLTKQRANYSDDCTDYWHSGAVLSERISDGIARVNIELSEPGEYYVCFQRRSDELNDQNQTQKFKSSGWIHQGSNYHVTLRVDERLMPIPLQISLIILCLVLSGTFSGLNLGLMSLDLNEIQVIIRCGTDLEKQYAKIIAPIRKKGNYLLCSILFGNVLVNSTLTILMDDLTSGLVAVVVSTLSIVVFGEIVPQAICSRHGLAVGAKTIYLTKLFMLLTFPLSLFISKILDRVLGEEIGHVYDRERLMEYIKITKTYNQLEDEEMNIISGALGLKTKTAESIMTRIEDAFMLPITATLDFKTVSLISKKGYSRIPVYDSYLTNIVALLHSKDLTFIDPDDKKPLRTIIEFYKHPLLHVEADERLYNVLNCFKTGRSHMAFVRKLFNTDDEDPFYEIIGLVTLEDVIEEILQMEINDETDILTDNRRKIKRKEAQCRQDFSDFLRVGGGELSSQAISPQLALASFQFLSTAVEPFQRKFIAENILRLLIGQKIYHLAEISELEERTYLTACTLGSFNAIACPNEDESRLLYKCGKPADYFILILEGRVRVTVGNERLSYEAGPFTYFGVSVLRPPVLATKMLLGSNSIPNINSTAPLNNQGDMNIASDPPSIEAIPLLEFQSPQSMPRSGLSSPEIIMSPNRSSSSTNSELCAKGQFEAGKVFVPDFTVKPVEKTLYMKIPRKVYLAAFRASLIDRKDELLEHHLEMLSKEEVDGLLYSRLTNASQTIESTLQNSKMNKSSSDLIKEKRFSIAGILPKLIAQPEAPPNTTNESPTQPSPPTIATSQVQQQQAPTPNVAIGQQRRSSIITENNKQSSQSSKAIRKLIQQNAPPSRTEANNLTNLTTISVNNNNYTAVNNNLSSAPITNIITNPQLENVVVDGGSPNEGKTSTTLF